MLQRRVACLVEAGAPANPELVSPPTITLPGDAGFAPAELIWSRAGKQFSTTAVLTYYGPDITYYELAAAFGLPQKRVVCPDPAPVVTLPVNPIGRPRPDRCAHCFESIGEGAGDKFGIGAQFSDGSGTYLKRRGWFAFVPYGYWERL
jgi:hypothetical protein